MGMGPPPGPHQGVSKMLNELLLNLRHSPITRRVNYLKIPCTVYQINDEGARKFNKIYDYIRSLDNLNTIVRTPSGGISIERRNFKPPMWDLRENKACIELTIILKEGMWRIQFRVAPKDEDNHGLYGSTCFKLFKSKCLEYGINLDDYVIDNGAEVKKEIEKPLIKLEREVYKNKTLFSVHHIDFHSSYPTGLINTHPEFKEPIEWMYKNRKLDNGKWKLVLNASIGYMQSIDCCNARWAQLSRDAIKDNNDRIRKLVDKLKASGRVIISYNTDGIWYLGEIYHDPVEEGPNLGQWENDHINCKFRAKSAGSYEFIDNDNKYTPVVRGFTKLDSVKSRDEWEWGDIYQEDANILIYKFIPNVGITRDGGKL